MNDYGFIKRLVFNKKRNEGFKELFMSKGVNEKVLDYLVANKVNLSVATPKGEWITVIADENRIGDLKFLGKYEFIDVTFNMKNFYFHELEEHNIDREEKIQFTWDEPLGEGDDIPAEIDAVYCEVIEYHLITNPGNSCGSMLCWGRHSNSCSIG